MPTPTVNSSNSTGTDAGGTTISMSCTTAGTNVVLAVGVGSSDATPNLTTSVTHNGSGTGWVEMFDGVASSFHTSGHYKVAPEASGTLLATLAGSEAELVLCYAVLNGVNQSSPVGTVPSVASGDTATSSITIASAVDDLCLAFPYSGFNGFSPGASETQVTETIVAAQVTGAIFSEVATGSSTVIAPTETAGGFDTSWITCGVAFKGASAATAALTGTVTAAIAESDIVTGGKTVILTLTGDTYVPSAGGGLSNVGSQVNSFAGKTAETTVTFALTGGSDAVPAAGDLVIVAYTVGSTADRALTIRNTSGGTDYVLIDAELYQNDNFDSNLRVAYRFMPGTPETSFVLSGTGNVADAGAYTVHVFRGVDPTTPLDVAAVPAGGTDSRVVDPGAILPTTAGAWIYVVGAGAGATGGTYTAGYLTDFNATTRADTNDAFIGSGYVPWTSGTYDPAAFAGGGTSTVNDSWTAMTVALRPVVTTPFADARAALSAGCVSAQSDTNGWNERLANILPATAWARTSDTVATGTLVADAGFDITQQHVIEVTIPGSILTGGAPIVATPTFTVDTGAGAAFIPPLPRQKLQAVPRASLW